MISPKDHRFSSLGNIFFSRKVGILMPPNKCFFPPEILRKIAAILVLQKWNNCSKEMAYFFPSFGKNAVVFFPSIAVLQTWCWLMVEEKNTEIRHKMRKFCRMWWCGNMRGNTNRRPAPIHCPRFMGIPKSLQQILSLYPPPSCPGMRACCLKMQGPKYYMPCPHY